MEEKIYVPIDGLKGFMFSSQKEADKFLKGEANIKRIYETLGLGTNDICFNVKECFTASEWDDVCKTKEMEALD